MITVLNNVCLLNLRQNFFQLKADKQKEKMI